MENCSLYWSRTTRFLSFPQDQEDLHIRKDTILMPYVITTEELDGIPQRIAWISRTRSNPWLTQIWPNLENLLMVIRRIKIKNQLGAVFSSFVHECLYLWMHFLRNVNIILMSACTWNQWTCVSNILVIMNFADVSKRE